MLTGAMLVTLTGLSSVVAQTDEGALRWAAPAEVAVDDSSEPMAAQPKDLYLSYPDSSDSYTNLCGDCMGTCGSYCPPPVWYVGAQALFLNRTRSREIKIVEDQEQSPAPPRGQRTTLMTTDVLDFDYEWGPQLTLGRRLGGCRRLEVSYWGLHHWNADATILADPEAEFANISLPFDSDYTEDFDGAERADVHYASELHNVEVNLLFDRGWLVTPLIGVRYMNLEEEFDFQSAETNGDTSNYLIGTRNNLVGFQLGARLERQTSSCFRWYGGAKAGVYGNMAKQNTWLGDVNNSIVLRNFSNSEEDVAFIGELDLGLACQLSRCFSINAGYRVLWVEGVALAPEQLDLTTTDTSGSGLNDNGGVFYDGGYVGLIFDY